METLLDYGTAKFKVILSDEVLTDPDTGKPSQVTIDGSEFEGDAQVIKVHKQVIEPLTLGSAIAFAIDSQFTYYITKHRPNDPQISSNDYFWSINQLLRLSSALTFDLIKFCKDAGLEFSSDNCNYGKELEP